MAVRPCGSMVWVRRPSRVPARVGTRDLPEERLVCLADTAKLLGEVLGFEPSNQPCVRPLHGRVVVAATDAEHIERVIGPVSRILRQLGWGHRVTGVCQGMAGDRTRLG